MKKSSFTTTRSFRCSRQLDEALEYFARQTNCPASEVVRDAIARYIPARDQVGEVRHR